MKNSNTYLQISIIVLIIALFYLIEKPYGLDLILSPLIFALNIQIVRFIAIAAASKISGASPFNNPFFNSLNRVIIAEVLLTSLLLSPLALIILWAPQPIIYGVAILLCFLLSAAIFSLFYPLIFLLNDFTVLDNNDLNLSKIDSGILNDIKIYIMPEKFKNALSMGILSFTQSIIIGKSFYNELSEHALKCLIFHELGHLKLGHLKNGFFHNLILTLILIISSWSAFYFLKNNYLSYALVGAFGGLFMSIIPDLIQKKFEYEADLFASKKMGRETMISALDEINLVGNGFLARKSLSHPSLDERIKLIRENS